MSYEIGLIFSFSIIIAAIIGWVRFKKINPVYYPFIVFVWLGCLNEIVSYFISKVTQSNAVNTNVYNLLESLVIAWQFYRWKLFRSGSLYIIIGILLSSWITENLIVSKLNNFNSYFKVFYSFIIVLMSIAVVNMLLVTERKALLKNPAFLICISFIVFFFYTAVVEVFWIYGLNEGKEFRIKVYMILQSINLVTNLVYALAILWMPTKQRFTLPS